MNLEAQPAILVASLLLNRLPRIIHERIFKARHNMIRAQYTEQLSRTGVVILLDAVREARLRFWINPHVPVVRERQEAEAPPVGRTGSGEPAVGVRILDQAIQRITTGADRVVPEGG